jgi:hypothetical protein
MGGWVGLYSSLSSFNRSPVYFWRMRLILAVKIPPQMMKNMPMMVKASERERESTNFPKIGDRIAKDKLPVMLATDRAVALTSDPIRRFIASNINGKAEPRRKAFKNIMGKSKGVLNDPSRIKAGAISRKRYTDAFFPIFVSIIWACLEPNALNSWKAANITPKYPIPIPIDS